MAITPDSIRVKIERAHHHIADLDGAIDRFLKTGPYKTIGEIDAEQRPTYRISNMQPINPMILAIAGDAIQNLRTSLDYMACALWRTTNGGDCKIYFPTADSAEEYPSAEFRKTKGLGENFKNAISKIEPYKGGKGDLLWRLNKLSVIDKHRLPITIVGANLGVHLPSIYPELFPESAKSNPWILGVTDMRFSLKDNDILFRDDSGRELKQDLQFPFFIALDEPGIFERQPLIPALKGMCDFVENVISDLCLLLN